MTFFAASAVAPSSPSASFFSVGKAGLPRTTSATRALWRMLSCRSVMRSASRRTQASIARSAFAGSAFSLPLLFPAPDGCAPARNTTPTQSAVAANAIKDSCTRLFIIASPPCLNLANVNRSLGKPDYTSNGRKMAPAAPLADLDLIISNNVADG